MQAHDEDRAGAIAVNKATIYHSLGDGLSASAAADQAVGQLEHSPNKEYLAKALGISGSAKVQLKRYAEAIATLQRAVDVAHQAGKPELKASAEDYLGAQLIETGQLAQSEQVLQDAHAIDAQLHDEPGMVVVNGHIADLRYHQKRYKDALALIDRVLASPHYDPTIPRIWPLQLKGRCLSALGQPDAALAAFAAAINAADQWRRDTLSGDVTATDTVVSLSEVYLDYVRQAASLATEKHNAALARKALGVLISNRASNLRQEVISDLRRKQLFPAHYYELISDLQVTQARVTLGRDPATLKHDQQKLQQIRLELSDLENKITGQDQNFSSVAERNSPQTSLSSIQARLREDELLLSFSLGEPKSFLWAVTNAQVSLYELPPANQISSKAQAFTHAAESNHLTESQGTELSGELFGQLPAGFSTKHHWLISADGALLDGFPFSALPDPSHRDARSSLITSHTLRLLPSEALRLDAAAAAAKPTFLGIADPIYNQADPRRHGGGLTLVSNRTSVPGLNLGRLIGSEREVKASAIAVGLPEVHILTGVNATLSQLQALLPARPQVIHFAVHVVSPETQTSDMRGEAALALSLNSDRIPELLTKETIAMLRVPGSLVVLSGCASQQGVVLPGAGVVGLSRAWLLAGASAVLVTAWPTPDESGHFFETFYSRLRGARGTIGERAAVALQNAQSEMRNSSGYRSSPSFWAAYSLISKE